MLQKLIVTNRKALTAKYQARGLANIVKALNRLKLAHALRGIQTHIEYLDAPSRKRITKVARASDEPACKKAIDQLYAACDSPDYLMILGASDVVPHQRLVNPLRGPDDIDRNVPSDLPYACEAKYSKKIEDFLGPTRAVGRLPDVLGATDERDLIAVIDLAAQFDGTPGEQRFVVSARVWQEATDANIKKAFGSKGTIKYSPKDGPDWPHATLRSPLHFINCHGADSDPTFYGQPAGVEDFPQALLAASLDGFVTEGAVIAAECCFGAQLYEPEAGDAKGIANTYLLNGATAFCGSTNVAYGAGTGEDRCAADVLCTQFMEQVLAKATTGRALLQARQDLVAASAGRPLDPMDLKTLGQFVLLGDPSLRPFGVPTGDVKVRATGKNKVSVTATTVAAPTPKSLTFAAHAQRRRKLFDNGEELSRTATAVVQSKGAVPLPLRESMQELIESIGMRPGRAMQFAVDPAKARRLGGPAQAKGPARKGMAKAGNTAATHDEKIQVIFAQESASPRQHSPAAAKSAGAVRTVRGAQAADSSRGAPPLKSVGAIVARTRGAEVLSYKVVWSK